MLRSSFDRAAWSPFHPEGSVLRKVLWMHMLSFGTNVVQSPTDQTSTPKEPHVAPSWNQEHCWQLQETPRTNLQHGSAYQSPCQLPPRKSFHQKIQTIIEGICGAHIQKGWGESGYAAWPCWYSNHCSGWFAPAPKNEHPQTDNVASAQCIVDDWMNR